jgi:hypothetical protein
MPRSRGRTKKGEGGAMPALVLGTIAGLLLAFFAPGGKPSEEAPPPVDADAEVVAGAAAYPTETFDVGSLIIPMDECHQYSGQNTYTYSRQTPMCYCPDST